LINGPELMRGQQERTALLFSYITTKGRIPPSHPLRQVQRLADQSLDRLNPTFYKLNPEVDRPSMPPEQLSPVAAGALRHSIQVDVD
jgi:hypothetical protein